MAPLSDDHRAHLLPRVGEPHARSTHHRQSQSRRCRNRQELLLRLSRPEHRRVQHGVGRSLHLSRHRRERTARHARRHCSRGLGHLSPHGRRRRRLRRGPQARLRNRAPHNDRRVGCSPIPRPGTRWQRRQHRATPGLSSGKNPIRRFRSFDLELGA